MIDSMDKIVAYVKTMDRRIVESDKKSLQDEVKRLLSGEYNIFERANLGFNFDEAIAKIEKRHYHEMFTR